MIFCKEHTSHFRQIKGERKEKNTNSAIYFESTYIENTIEKKQIFQIEM